MSQLAVNMVHIELREGEDTVDLVFVAIRRQTKHNEWEGEKNVCEEVRGLVLQEFVTKEMVTPKHTGPTPTLKLNIPTGKTNIWGTLCK